MNLPSVPRLWPNATVVCLGGGPSLTREDVDYCRGKARVLAINDAYRLADWADVLYGCDARWWTYHKGVPSFQGPKYALQPSEKKWPGVTVLQNTGVRGLELDPTSLRTGKNSGYQAVNLAVHLGARRIILLGYDMKHSRPGKGHWFGDHPPGLNAISPYGQFCEYFKTLVEPLKAAGIIVINCSRRTALTAFPCATLEDVLPVADEACA